MIGIGIVAASLVVSQVNYVRDRFDAFLNPDADTSGRGITYQIKNALTAVG
mgnify:FL=1